MAGERPKERVKLLDRAFALIGVPAATSREEAVRTADEAIASAQSVQSKSEQYNELMRELDRSLIERKH